MKTRNERERRPLLNQLTIHKKVKRYVNVRYKYEYFYIKNFRIHTGSYNMYKKVLSEKGKFLFGIPIYGSSY